MFSSIISLFKNITKAKYNKEKKETKKKVKQEEIKILKQLKNKLAGVAHIKAKEAESVKDSEKKAKKLKTQVFLLNLLQTFIEFLEFTFGSIITIVILLLFCIALVFIIVWIALNGLLHIDMSLGNGSIFNGSKEEECIQGSQVMAGTGYDLDAISQLQGTMTEYHKQLYNTLSIYNEILTDTSVFQENKYIDPVISTIGKDNMVKFLMGFGATECGMKFGNGGNGESVRDITKYPSKMEPNSAGYAFLGLKAANNKFDGYYTYSGNASDSIKVLKDNFVTDWQKKYKPEETFYIANNFVPYGAATQSGNFATENLKYTYTTFDIDTLVPEVAKNYGINQNIDVLTAYIRCFSGAAAYHAGFSGNVQNKDGTGPDTGLISLWCALWASTSDVDANRSFDNIKIIYSNETDYTESTARTKTLGVDGDSNLHMKWGATSDSYFSINGQTVNVTLWSWVRDNCGNTGYFDSTAKTWLDGKGGSTLILNSHYGLMALLMGNRIVNDLGGTVPVATGGSIDDCECYEVGGAGSVNLGNRDFSGVKAGEIQGNYPSNIVDKMKKDSTYSQHFGKLKAVTNSTSVLAGGVTYEEWRLKSKWQVPYQHQSSKHEEWAYLIDFGGVRMYNINKLGIKTKGAGNLCPLMMQSYIFSAMTGKAINVAELTALGRAYGGSGRYWEAIAQAAGDSGFYIRGFEYNPRSDSITAAGYATKDAETNAPILYPEKNGIPSTDIVAMINYVLDNNGIVGVNVRGKNDSNVNGCNSSYPTSQFAYSNHYFCITHREGDTYYTHSASNPSLDVKGHSIDDIIGTDGSALCVCWMYNMFFAYNPSLSVGNSTLGDSSSSQVSSVSSFENFIFIGDSFTVGLSGTLSSKNKGFDVYAAGGAYPDQFVKDDDSNGTYDIFEKSVTIGTGGSAKSVGPLPDGTGKNGIVFLLGVNQAPHSNATGEVRGGHIDNIKAFLTALDGKYDIPIYVQKVFPLGSGYNSFGITADAYNKAVSTINAEIETFCNSLNGLIFIDTTSGLVENGYLKYPDDENLHIDSGTTINGVSSYEYWYSNIEKAVLGGSSSSNGNTRIECISTSKGDSTSTIGSADLGFDVIDVTEKIKKNSWGNSYTKMRNPEDIKFIVVHYWGSNSTKSGKGSNLVSSYKSGGMRRDDGYTYMAQYVVDKDNIYRTAPDLASVWHAGGGIDTYKYSGYFYDNALKPLGMERCTNSNSIGIEAANTNLTGEDGVGGFYVYEKGTVENLIFLTKALMKEYNIDVNHVYRHYDCVMKTCPAPFIDDQYLWKGSYTDYDKGNSQNWKAFKECLTSDTIDWSKFNEHVVDDLS